MDIFRLPASDTLLKLFNKTLPGGKKEELNHPTTYNKAIKKNFLAMFDEQLQQHLFEPLCLLMSP